jgi:peptidoglycan hydrolase-like protein with peptidoglycan-binding domain
MKQMRGMDRIEHSLTKQERFSMFKKKTRSSLVGGLLIIIALGFFFGLQTLSSFSAGAAGAWPVVGQGSKGENVYSIQLQLKAHGYSLSIDGNFGPQTAANVKSFQSAHHLSADGVVGSQTWPALIITVKQGSTGPAVTALQRQLNAHGQHLVVDGNFGPATATAVRSFQSSKKIGVDGIAGPQTWNSLVSTGSVTPPPPPPPPSGGTLAKVVSIANAIKNGHAEPGWHGGAVPYSWGGGHGSKPGPSLGTCSGYTGSIHPCPANHTVGVDCSGFSRWVYDLAFGADVLGSGNTDSQLRHLHQVSASAAKPGDLVYFGTRSNTHHVGIYIGNGLMINALKTGTNVQTNHVSALSDLVGYFRY